MLISHLRFLGGVLISEISQNRMLLAHLLGIVKLNEDSCDLIILNEHFVALYR